MISFIKGIIDEVFLDGISVDVNGTGYYIYLSRRHLQVLNQEQEVKIFTTLIHREDSMKLFGFPNKEEREIFNLLLSVSGIGAKTALGVLSEFSGSDIVVTIYANDSKKLSKAPGIGIKTAQRIILELKEKISGFRAEITESSVSGRDSGKIEQYEETEAALFALGYNTHEVNNALKWLSEMKKDLEVSDDMIREALIWLSN